MALLRQGYGAAGPRNCRYFMTEKKTPARGPAFQKTALSLEFIGGSRHDDRLSIIVSVIMMAVPVVPAVFPAEVMAVNPMMPV